MRALAERDPEAAIDLIERRKGPAHPKFGVTPAVAQMILKQAKTKLEADDGARAIDGGAASIRALADREAAVAAYGRGEGTEAALSLRGLEDVGASRVRQLRHEAHGVRQRRKQQEKAAKDVRKRLAQGLKLDADDAAHADGLDLVYLRDMATNNDDGKDVAFSVAAGMAPKSLIKKIGALVLSDEVQEVIAGVKLVEALERVDPALTKRLDHHVLHEAHEMIDIVEGGVDWADAVRLSREGVDIAGDERERRSGAFAMQSDPGWIERALSEAFGLEDADNPQR